MESKCPDETLRMRGMNLNLCILRMLEDTFLLGAAQLVLVILREKTLNALDLMSYEVEVKRKNDGSVPSMTSE